MSAAVTVMRVHWRLLPDAIFPVLRWPPVRQRALQGSAWTRARNPNTPTSLPRVAKAACRARLKYGLPARAACITSIAEFGHSHWLRNIQSDERVQVRLGEQRFRGKA